MSQERKTDVEIVSQFASTRFANKRDLITAVSELLNDTKTRNGNPVNPAVTVNNAIRALERKGYRVEQSFVIIPPEADTKSDQIA